MTGGRRWYKVDLHAAIRRRHGTTRSRMSLTWIGCAKVVEKGIEIVAITDHNTVAGIGAIRRELEWLARLE